MNITGVIIVADGMAFKIQYTFPQQSRDLLRVARRISSAETVKENAYNLVLQQGSLRVVKFITCCVLVPR